MNQSMVNVLVKKIKTDFASYLLQRFNDKYSSSIKKESSEEVKRIQNIAILKLKEREAVLLNNETIVHDPHNKAMFIYIKEILADVSKPSTVTSPLMCYCIIEYIDQTNTFKY